MSKTDYYCAMAVALERQSAKQTVYMLKAAGWTDYQMRKAVARLEALTDLGHALAGREDNEQNKGS